MEIRLLDNKSIDKKAWDRCLFESPGFELYMQASYLDVVSPKWKALVAGDYEAVFPVFEKKVLVWRFLRQPLFTGPCLVCGTDKFAIKSLIDYLTNLFKKYHWIDINIFSDLPALDKAFQKESRRFQRVKISDQGFIPDNNLRRNLKKAEQAEIENLEEIQPEEFINGIKKYLLSIHKTALKSSGLRLLNKIIQQRSQYGGKLVKITNNDKKLNAAQFVLTGHNKLYIILSFSTPEGRTNRALHALQVKLINQYLQPNGTLHFGGSNIEKVAEYNHNYGAEDIYYLRIHHKTIL